MKLHLVLVLSVFPFLVEARTQPADTVIRGVVIRFDYDENSFPSSWLEAPINGSGESLAAGEKKRSRAVISRALNKYPTRVLRENLKEIYVLRSISFYNVGYGGTNSNDIVFVTNNGTVQGYTDNYIEQTFHHEFSSILYRNFPLLLNEISWQEANPPGFDYKDPENGVGAIRNNESSQEIDTALCRLGFLTQYALSGLENDINTIAQNLFQPSPGFWRIVDAYPLIARKTRLLVAFYNRIDPSFTESYFFNKQ